MVLNYLWIKISLLHFNHISPPVIFHHYHCRHVSAVSQSSLFLAFSYHLTSLCTPVSSLLISPWTYEPPSFSLFFVKLPALGLSIHSSSCQFLGSFCTPVLGQTAVLFFFVLLVCSFVCLFLKNALIFVLIHSLSGWCGVPETSVNLLKNCTSCKKQLDVLKMSMWCVRFFLGITENTT